MSDVILKLSMPLTASTFPFSRRMLNFFDYVGIITVADLAAIPLKQLTCFRGFKTKCRQELTAFIDYEGIEVLFDGYQQWRNSKYTA